jgi:hypothetical protein
MMQLIRFESDIITKISFLDGTSNPSTSVSSFRVGKGE